MKKNNTYLADDEINLGDLVKSLWREKILILSISIICGLASYLYSSFQPQEFRAEIKLKIPPTHLFLPYTQFANNSNNNNYNYSNNYSVQFMSDFKLHFLSLESLQSFVDESKEFDNFKEYLKSRNISAKNYFANKIGEVKENNLIIPNQYFLVFPQELNGDIFLNNYVEFIKNKTIFETKINFKYLIEQKKFLYEDSFEKAKLINLENPIQRSINEYIIVNKPEDIFYKGTKILALEITALKKLLIKLENEQFNYNIILDKSLSSRINETGKLKYFQLGLMFGLILSFVIIFFKSILKNN
jgi:LPS O-antigen subunit length determinant protein (WzzB/FepE family)